MRSFKDLNEARSNTCVFTFGRFNPPTSGHEKLLDAVLKQAAKNGGSPYYVFASHSENPKKDPLPYVKKVAYMKKMFPKHARNIVVDKARQVFEIAVSLYNKGHRSIVMVVGSDRVVEFQTLLNKYNDVDGRHGYYGFDDIKVISAGERDPDAEGVAGMSASKMRSAAASDNYDSFKNGLPSGFGQGLTLFKDVRKYMGIRESFITHQVEQTEEDVIRDMYVRGEILNIGDVVTESYSGVSGKVIRRGTNYLVFSEQDGTTHKKWLYELDEMSSGQLIKQVMSKTTNKKGYDKASEVLKTVIDRKKKENAVSHDIIYYATQIARSFSGVDGRILAKTYTKKYEDVNQVESVDVDAKVEPSKYTNKFKQILDEEVPSSVPQEEFQLDEKLEGLVSKSDDSGISYGILKQVYDRGLDAWKTGHRPGTTPEQWAEARVNSFITGGKTRTTGDADLWKQSQGQKEDSNEWGTDSNRKDRQRKTPAQPVISFKEHIVCETDSLIESNSTESHSEDSLKLEIREGK